MDGQQLLYTCWARVFQPIFTFNFLLSIILFSCCNFVLFASCRRNSSISKWKIEFFRIVWAHRDEERNKYTHTHTATQAIFLAHIASMQFCEQHTLMHVSYRISIWHNKWHEKEREREYATERGRGQREEWGFEIAQILSNYHLRRFTFATLRDYHDDTLPKQ